ncbi:DUF1134 domain-containing protein [Salaquimonas pukyongi]|uniref:DUF1134 domain-containing protein n=1 Tax=Salaquimonas pukyongi TaxID=2712698 RepID=UPI0009F84ADC|nr:EipA family protein [Salaquimonas pukyongi]
MSELIWNAPGSGNAATAPLGRRILGFILQVAFFVAVFSVLLANAKPANAQASQHYSAQEIVDAGHNFFGKTSGALASAIERTFAERGMPNGYILGEEAGGAFIGGLRYGEGVLYTKNAGDHKVFWQGPSIGWDYGIDGNRTMMLVYNLPDVPTLYRRYFGVSGSAYLVGGVGVTALTNRGVHLVPIRTGLGVRLGANVGYLKLSTRPMINPF